MNYQIEQKIRSLELLTNRALRSVLAGEYHTMQKGIGVEFYQLRDYIEGDDIRFIDWKSSLRLGKTMVRDCIEQRQQTIVILLDISASQLYGSRKPRFELYQKIAAILALAAARVGDKCAVITFTDRVHEYWSPRASSRKIGGLLEQLFNLRPLEETTRLMPAFLRAQHEHHNQGLFFLLSDCLAVDTSEALQSLVAQEDGVIVRLLDPLERTLSTDMTIKLEDVESGEILDLAAGDRAYAQAVEQLLTEVTLQALAHALLDIDATSDEAQDDSMLVDQLINFFMLRKIANMRRL